MTSIAVTTMLLFLSQVPNDPLARTADEAAERLRAEERRFQLGASTAADVTLHRRELTRARRAVALRDNASVSRVAALFEEEIQIALQQLDEEERRFQLGASNDSTVAERRRDLLATRRSFAEWKSRLLSSSPDDRSAARGQVKALLEEEIAVAQRQLQIEQRMVDLGALTGDSVAKRRAEIADLEAASNALR
ncbi:MAG: hypothetical protein WD696_12985 [Bryobacteraceae bacterium]